MLKCCSQSPLKSFICSLLLLFVLACSVSNEYARESDDFYTPKNEVSLPSLYSVLVARRDATTMRVKVRLIR